MQLVAQQVVQPCCLTVAPRVGRPVARTYDPGMRLRPTTLAAALAAPLLLVSACGSPPAAPSGSGESSDAADASAACDTDDLPVKQSGTLTVATDTPAYDPWFSDDDPTNGEGFESAVAYAVADRLGFSEDQVEWVTVPFNNSYTPGAKSFDFDINQISITPERERAVDFSEGYYTVTQAVVALDDEDLQVGSLDDLKSLRLGAQTGTTSLSVLRDVVQPDQTPVVLQNTNLAKQQLLNGQLDAIVTDLPTAFYITAAEIEGSTILGQFEQPGDDAEQFGLLLEKGSALTPCVDQALEELRGDGTLEEIQQQWLSSDVDVPVLQ